MLDWFFDEYGQYEEPLSKLQLICFMLGMGATLTAADFLAIGRRPRSLLAGAAAQFLMTPLLAYLVNRVSGVPAGIAFGLILVAAMPGGTLSKAFAYLGRGNLALSISLTVCGTFASMVTVPLLLRLLVTGVPDDFVMPVGEIVLSIVVFSLLPLAAGMSVARFAPAHRLVFSRWCIRLGFVVVVLMVTGSLGSGRIHPGEYGWRTPLAIIAFCLAAQQLSMVPFRLLGWPRADCLSVGMEATMRNLNLALLLMAQMFPAARAVSDPALRAVGDGVLFVILFYAAVAMCCGLPLALNFRRMARRDDRLRAAAGDAPFGG